MKEINKPIIIICVITLMMFHGCIIKAKRNQEARLYGAYQDRKITKEEYKQQKEKITYLSTIVKFKKVLTAFD